MTKLYYTPPTDKQFDELKQKAIEIWTPMGYEPSYAKEKIDRIKDIKNICDNFIYMVAMFDIQNQQKLANKLSDETRKAVRDRLLDGGEPLRYIVF